MYKIVSIVVMGIILSTVAVGYANHIATASITPPINTASMRYGFDSANDVEKCLVTIDTFIPAGGIVECKLVGDSGILQVGIWTCSATTNLPANEGPCTTGADDIEITFATPEPSENIHAVRVVAIGEPETPSTADAIAVNFIFDFTDNSITGCDVIFGSNQIPASGTAVKCFLLDSSNVSVGDATANADGSSTLSITGITCDFGSGSVPCDVGSIEGARVEIVSAGVPECFVPTNHPDPTLAGQSFTATIFQISGGSWSVNGVPTTFTFFDKDGDGFQDLDELGYDIEGTGDPDVIVATDEDDNVMAKGGADIICLEAGADFGSGEGGDDTMMGGPGNDNIASRGGTDALFGEDGDDIMRCEGGPNDFADGGLGTDSAGKDCENQVSIP